MSHICSILLLKLKEHNILFTKKKIDDFNKMPFGLKIDQLFLYNCISCQPNETSTKLKFITFFSTIFQ